MKCTNPKMSAAVAYKSQIAMEKKKNRIKKKKVKKIKGDKKCLKETLSATSAAITGEEKEFKEQLNGSNLNTNEETILENKTENKEMTKKRKQDSGHINKKLKKAKKEKEQKKKKKKEGKSRIEAGGEEQDLDHAEIKPKKKKKSKELVTLSLPDAEAVKEDQSVIKDNGSCPGEAVAVELLTAEEIEAVHVQDSREEGQKAFQWIIGPCTEEDFFSNYWEKGPLHIKRNNAQYYKGVFTTADLDKILHEKEIFYNKNLDITSYSDGKRETHNLIGQAHAPVVWDYYNNGCSVRMLNPQTFHRPVWRLLSILQEYFNSFCGANVYLTPPNTQGFAPHWDDIEAFVMQLEGKKHWRVYKPRSQEEELPVNSSLNLSQDEIGQPVLDITLEAGDLLYFPRGYIHQGSAEDDVHSLHITMSTYQRNTWGHLLEKLLPQALTAAMAEDVEYRRGLPRDYLDNMGIVNMDKESPGRNAFLEKVSELVKRLVEFAPIDAAVDQLGASFMHDALPPLLTQEDESCSVRGGGEHWCQEKKKVVNRVELDPDTPIRLIRGNCLRVVAEEENVNIYHCLENSCEYHQADRQFVEMVPENAPAIEALVHAYPKYITIESLPLSDEAAKMTVASGLWERGLVVTAKPLEAAYDD